MKQRSHDELDGAVEQSKASTGPARWVLAIAVPYILLMSLLPCSWAKRPAAEALVSAIASVVPMLSALVRTPSYSPCHGLLVAGFWLVSPAFLVLGYRSITRLPKDAISRIRANAISGYLVSLPFALAIFAFFFTQPVVFGIFGKVFDEASPFLPLRTLSWTGVAFAVYFVGMAAGSLRVRLFWR